MRDPVVLFLNITCFDRKGTEQSRSLRAIATSDLFEEHKKSTAQASLAGWFTGSHRKSYDQAADVARSWTGASGGAMSLDSFERSISKLMQECDDGKDLNGTADGHHHGWSMELSWTLPDGYLDNSSDLQGRRIVIQHDWDLNAFFKVHSGHGEHHKNIGPAYLKVHCWPQDPKPKGKPSSESVAKGEHKSSGSATAAPQFKREGGGSNLPVPAIGGMPASGVRSASGGTDNEQGYHTSDDGNSPGAARKR